ncbi:MAG: 3-isopropylmalate dehydratase small subunit [Thermodesulforhabdaceae bacterium]
MRFRGRAWLFGDNIDTDAIIPARYLNTSNAEELAKHCMEDADPDFVRRMKAGDIIVAGKNFGCGSSREHAPLAIKAAGISCVLAESFARIFYRNAFNMGLPILECPAMNGKIKNGDEIEVDLAQGIIKNHSTGEVFHAEPIPPFMQELIEAGGLIPYVKKRLRLE